MSTVLTLFALVLAASLASWAFFQWLGARRARSSASIAVYALGVVGLAAAATLAILAATRWRAPEAPVAQPRSEPISPFVVLPEPASIDAAPPVAAFAEAPAEPEAAAVEQPQPSTEERIRARIVRAQRHFHAHEYERAAALGEELLALVGENAELRVLVANSYYLLERFEDADRHIEAAIGSRLGRNQEPPLAWLRFQWSTSTRLSHTLERARVQQVLLQNFPEHRSAFLQHSDDVPVLISTRDAPPVSAPAPRAYAPPRALLPEWSRTDCVLSVRSKSSDAPRMFLDNECADVVALVFASCAYATAGCNASAQGSSGWRYEPDGVVLTTAHQRPLMDRIAEDGPLIAPTYPLSRAHDAGRIRFVACSITEPAALGLLSEPALATEERRQQLRAALERDACYARVLELTRLGARSGRSLDALLSRA